MNNKLNELSPVYFPNELDIAKTLFTPVASVSVNFRCLSGYFSSKIFAELAEPLSILFKNPNAKGRFLISPHLDEFDKEALYDAYKSNNSIYKYLFKDEDINICSLTNATLDFIKFLVATNKLDIRVVVMKEGMMHAKIWIFDIKEGKVAIHGSSNATKSGLMRNFEQLVFNRSWESNSSAIIVKSFESRFDSFWGSKRDDSYTLSLNDKTICDLLKSTTTSIEHQNHSELLEKISQYMENKKTIKKITTPKWLNYRDGEYSHQGEAIDCWLINRLGTLEIATGGGKTLTSLVCSDLALAEFDNAVLVIAVPNKPLIKQWALDVESFGITPIDTEGMSSKNIRRVLSDTFRKQKYIAGHDVIIITHNALKNDFITDVFDKYSGKLMLIADEAHNLGSENFVKNPPKQFNYKLALSATPQRQYDEIGTKLLFDYFGDIIYSFSLKDAINKCLVPFDYLVHKIYLTAEEQDSWIEYTEKINNLMWNKDDPEAKKIIEQYLIRRRAICESASKKIDKFEIITSEYGINNYSLAFCSSKGPKQLEDINKILKENDYTFHQVTSEETSNRNLMAQLVKSYSEGNIDILTSKKVLDEGFNIPPIREAYFLANSSVIRTWVQRLGRVLRQSKKTNKTHATIHDFVVIPYEINPIIKPIIESELERMLWFSSHARNGSEVNGPNNLINEYIEILENI